MTDPAIIEAAARALHEESQFIISDDMAREFTSVVLAAVTPMIRAQVLEEAARLIAVSAAYDVIDLAAAIRTLKEQP